MNKPNTTYITIGKIGSSYGVRGWLKIHSYTESNAGILNYQPWFLTSDHENFARIEVEDSRPHGKIIIAKLAGINTPEEAALLTGKMIAIKREQLPDLKKHEYYWSDLMGFKVINKDGVVYGKVIYLMETGSNDVLVIKGEKEHAIPFILGNVILDIDLVKQEIHVDWELL